MFAKLSKITSSILVSSFTLAFLLFATPQIANGEESPFKSGYFMCSDLPLQLRWFTKISSMGEFTNKGKSTRIPLSNASPQAMKALREGWCASTDGMEFFSLLAAESCGTEWSEIPNGGCVKVTVSPRQSNFTSTWYTFRDALK